MANLQYYIAGGMGGFLMGLSDYLTKEESDQALITKLGFKLTELFNLSLGDSLLSLVFLSILGAIFVWAKNSDDRWDSLIIGAAAFATVSAFTPNHDIQEDLEKKPIDNTLSTLEELGTADNNDSFDKFNYVFKYDNSFFLRSAYADTYNDLTGRSNYLLYIKGGKYQKVIQSKVRAYKDNDRSQLAGEQTYIGNRIFLNQPAGNYTLEITSKTYSDKIFQFSVNINIIDTPSGSIVTIDKTDLKPTSFLSRIINNFPMVNQSAFNKFETYKQIGLYKSSRKEYLEAISFYEKALSQELINELRINNDEINKVNILLGYTYFRNNDLYNAEKILHSLYLQFPNNQYAWINYVKVLCAKNNFASAKTIFQQKLEGNQKFVENEGEIQRVCGNEQLKTWFI